MKKSMDLWSPPSKLKKRQCSGCRSLPEDRISSLPDDILLFILSLLTLKEVGMTSILSRRWVKLWVHNPVLNFHTQISDSYSVNKRERQNYVDWVNNVLGLHKAQSLKEFKIVCDLDKNNRKDISKWLEYALARKVENLELNLLFAGLYPHDQDDNYVFPKRFLNLSRVKASRFPKHDFKSLKSLSLKRVNVNGEAINFFLLNCPYLERLEVAGTPKLVNLVISDPTLVLKYLQITDCYDLEVLSISNFNLVSLTISARGDLTLTDLPMLVELSISGNSDKLSHCFSQASSCHSQLQNLILKVAELEDIIQLSKSNISQMPKLKRLVIEVGVSGDESITKLFSFLNSCPRLMEFVFRMWWCEPERTSRAIRKGKKCSLKCLEVLEFRGYYSRVSDIEMIMHVVENSVCLKKISIDTRDIKNIGPSISAEELEARSVALHQFKGLRECIPPHVDLVIC